ncbi:F0F1 ATP synthase subunit gamma [Candidatus Gracilibacteria bacterium]|nr:F0F1 ATP synthase subunit gamma [Candidatus Gracilibacteria bacterium]
MSGILLETKKKIHSFKGTRKMTKAMELVAASKMRSFQRRVQSARHFAWDLIHLLQANFQSFNVHPLLQVRTSGPVLFIIYTSDKGLCGGLNNDLEKTLFQSEAWLSCPAEQRILLTFGKKAYAHAQFNHIPVEAHFENITEQLSPVEALSYVHAILDIWESKQCRTVYTVVPFYKNPFVYYPQVQTLLPLSLTSLPSLLGPEPDQNAQFALGTDYMMYEPSAADIANTLIEQLVFSLFYSSFLELKATEYSSRMVAMKSATDATDEILDNLTLALNKARQQSITAELADLVNSSEAVSQS